MSLPNLSQLHKDLYYWIREREAIRLRREVEKLPKPWTKDPILRNTRFCNIRREDDKVTRWIAENWRVPFAQHHNLAFAMCLARIVNLPSTLQILGFPETWDVDAFIKKMDYVSASQEKVWTSAYMVTGGFSQGGETKQVIMGRVLDDAYRQARAITNRHSLATAQELLEGTKGMGTFLCAQVIADLKYTPLLENAPDWWVFCAPGPGSTMGLNFLHGRLQYKSITKNQFLQEVNELRHPIEDHTGYMLTAHDTQNCLCEFSKYVRIKYLGGRAKTSYQG